MSTDEQAGAPAPRPEATVRPANLNDADAIISLVIALADFEKLPPPDEAARKPEAPPAAKRSQEEAGPLTPQAKAGAKELSEVFKVMGAALALGDGLPDALLGDQDLFQIA